MFLATTLLLELRLILEGVVLVALLCLYTFQRGSLGCFVVGGDDTRLGSIHDVLLQLVGLFEQVEIWVLLLSST